MKHAFALLAALLPVMAIAQSGEPYFTANFGGPVTRYGHNALGSGHEWGSLTGTLRGRFFIGLIEEDLVFEDTSPRIVDLNQDGDPEILVTESSLTEGSRLAVWGIKGRIASGEFLGAPNHWLAIIGAADFDGDGQVEVAYIETPHEAKVLKLAHLEGDHFVTFAEAKGLTNHHFGSDVIESAVLDCGTSAVILTADADWTQVMVTRFENGKLISNVLKPYEGPQDFQNLPDCN